jgi:hypothetical protein
MKEGQAACRKWIGMFTRRYVLFSERHFSSHSLISLVKELCHAEMLSLAKKAETLASMERL